MGKQQKFRTKKPTLTISITFTLEEIWAMRDAYLFEDETLDEIKIRIKRIVRERIGPSGLAYEPTDTFAEELCSEFDE